MAASSSCPELEGRYVTTPSWFDPRAGAGGALLMGTLVALVNAPHGALPAATSAGKQALYTFFFGGFIVQATGWHHSPGRGRACSR